MLLSLFLSLQAGAPGDCLLTGLCGLVTTERSVPSGLMWLATGLVLAGAWGLRRMTPPR
ncbi:MAG: hypothetical protein ABJC19_01505 [Gemmatimonadota bacterium]